MTNCIFCKTDFDPQDERRNHTPPFNCQICKLSSSALYKLYVNTIDKAWFDTTDVCWDCDAKILIQHNIDQHNSVDIV